MTNYASLCLRSLRRLFIVASIVCLATNAFASGLCSHYLKGKKIMAHDASDAVDAIATLYNSNKTLVYDFTTAKKGEPSLIQLLKPQVDTLLNFSKNASKEVRFRFQKLQALEHTNFARSRFYDGRNDYEELSKLTGTLMLIGDSGSQYAKDADLLATNLTIFFAEIGLPFSVPQSLEEAKLRDKQLSDNFFETRVDRLKYNYALLLLADYGNPKAIETLKTYSSELLTDENQVLQQIDDMGGFIIDPQEEMKLVETGQHPGQFQRLRPRQRDIQQRSWLQRLVDSFN